jgi:hypothetical protein
MILEDINCEPLASNHVDKAPGVDTLPKKPLEWWNLLLVEGGDEILHIGMKMAIRHSLLSAFENAGDWMAAPLAKVEGPLVSILKG